jgi:hypothetical protein
MNSDIQPLSENFAQKYTENVWNVAALFFLLRKKKICKNKKYLPTTLAKESALIPLVKNQIPEYKISQQDPNISKYNHHTRSMKPYRKPQFYYRNP